MHKSGLLSFLGLLPDAALLLDAEGCIEGANELAAELLRIPLDDLEGMAAATLQPIGGHDPVWYSPGTRRVRLRNVSVEVAVRDVRVEESELHLAILREALVGTSDQAVDAWKIGLIERDFVAGTLRATPRLRELLGLEDSTLTTETITNVFHPDDQTKLVQAMEQAADPAGTGAVHFLGRVVKPDGAMRWVRAIASSEFAEIDGERRPVRVLVSLVDDTEQEELALAVQRHEERLRLATDVTGVGIFDRIILPTMVTPYWSASMREIIGYDPDTHADPDWFIERVHPDDMPRMIAAVDEANEPQGDGRVEVVVRWIHPDGDHRRFLIRSTTLFLKSDKAHVATRSIGAILDITEQSAAEDELRSRTAILDATPDFVGMADEEGRVLYLNKGARLFWGIGESDPVNHLKIGTLHTTESLLQFHKTGMPTVRRDGVWSGESTLRRHDGEMIPMSQVIVSHQTKSGETRFSTVSRDLSKLKLLEEQYRQSQKMEAIGRLAGGIAHDFNNLLSVIMGCNELAGMDLAPEHPARVELNEVGLAAERAAGLTRQLLAFGRKQILQPTVLDINDVLAEMKPLLQRLVDESIEVEVILIDQPAMIKAEHTQVQQILLNLVVNSRDAMPNGGILTVEALKGVVEDDDTANRLDLPAGDYAIIAVSDTGHGMSAEVREQIFDPFFTTKGPGQGTGLGLATVFGIVRQSGGSIWVYSEVGRGTTFKIYLPSSDEAPKAVRKPSVPLRAPQSGVILLAEDDAQLRKMVSNTLLRAGYEVITAESALEVLQAGREHEGVIDLLLTDVIMPGISGKQLAERLHESKPHTSVLYMSGYTENSIVHHGVLDDDVNFLAKPVTPGRLLSAIEDVLGRRVER
ncbi:MAG: two-component system cell cycle sensor histidine kinase/response regulator CckA [Polyangiales bacterium]